MLESIIRYNYCIKEVELNSHLESNKEILNVIDGKQRLSTIKSFLNNELEYQTEDEIIYFDRIGNIPKSKNKKMKKRIMTREEKRDFLAYQISTIKYKDLSIEIQQKIFKLSQNSIKTSIGELIKACPKCEIRNFMGELMDKHRHEIGAMSLRQENKRCQIWTRLYKLILICTKENSSVLHLATTNIIDNMINEKLSFEQKIHIENVIKKHNSLFKELYPSNKDIRKNYAYDTIISALLFQKENYSDDQILKISKEIITNKEYDKKKNTYTAAVLNSITRDLIQDYLKNYNSKDEIKEKKSDFIKKRKYGLFIED